MMYCKRVNIFALQADILWIAEDSLDNPSPSAMDNNTYMINTQSNTIFDELILNISSTISINLTLFKYSTIMCYLNSSNGLHNMDNAGICDLKNLLCGMYVDVYRNVLLSHFFLFCCFMHSVKLACLACRSHSDYLY